MLIHGSIGRLAHYTWWKGWTKTYAELSRPGIRLRKQMRQHEATKGILKDTRYGYPVSVCFAFLSPLLGWADASDPLWFGHPSKRYCIAKPADMQLPWLVISRTISGILCSAVVITCASSSKSQVTVLRNLPSEHVCQVQKPLQLINCWWFLLLFVLLFVFFEDLMKAYMRTIRYYNHCWPLEWHPEVSGISDQILHALNIWSWWLFDLQKFGFVIRLS